MLKINVEHESDGVAAAVAGIIENALAQHGFSNVKGKMVMVHQRPRSEAYFMRVSQIAPLTHPTTELDPVGHSTELLPARTAYGYPLTLDWMKAGHPDIFASPVLIDTGIEAAPYAEQVRKFEKGGQA